MDIKNAIHTFIDKIFQPPISFLDLAIEKLNGVNMVIAQGLNIGKYFSVFGDMPNSWQLVISSILISTVFLGSLLLFRSLMRMYYGVKEGVKWW
ncbi:hypothetical protein CHI02_23290 [Niallia circulans]|uniref:hypothetical protein n=1 Tax=Niallia circulans TaxID=1397 RepID=UPI000BA5DB0C|nr:hypothetical protein [Niallia circulans]PAE09790.1 hypothetical protein CHI02_23290 [Niallia circulans]